LDFKGLLFPGLFINVPVLLTEKDFSYKLPVA